MRTPPRLARWLLSNSLPSGDRDEVIGDLTEDFSEHVASVGSARASLWYWWNALRLIWTLNLQVSSATLSRTSAFMTLDDLRYATRRLAKHKGTTLASVVTLAVSIGAGVAAWSLLSTVLFNPLAVKDVSSLVVVGERFPSKSDPTGQTSPLRNDLNYRTYTEVQNAGIPGTVAGGGSWPALVTINGSSSYRRIYFASHNFLEAFGLTVQLGRGFLPADDQRGASPVALLSDRAWDSFFARRADVLGQTVQINRQSVTIIGVAPRRFHGPTISESPDFFIPLHVVSEIGGPQTNWFADPAMSTSPTSWVRIFVRLRAGIHSDQVISALSSLPVRPEGKLRNFGLTNASVAAMPEAVRPKIREFARLLAATVALLLVIGCLTAGMLVLLRTEARRGEFAMCLALGATRARLGLGVVIEGMLLSSAGAVLAVPVSRSLLAGLQTFQLPGEINIDLLDITVDSAALVVAVAAAMLSTLVIALIAGGFGFSANIANSLKTKSGITSPVGRSRTRAALIIAEVAIALVLLSGAGLFIRSFNAAINVNPGYDTHQLASGTVSVGQLGYTTDRATNFFDELRDRLSRNGAISSVSMTQSPGGMGAGGQISVDGQPVVAPSSVAINEVDEYYFPTIGLALSAGRNFSSDDRGGSPRVGIVSASLAKLIGAGGLNYRLQVLGKDQIDIVGVVPDLITNVKALEPLVLYTPIAQARQSTYRTIVVRATSDARAAMRETTETSRSMEPNLPIPTMATIEESLGKQMGPQRLGATVLGTLGGIAVLLTLFGIYVLVESMSLQRRREMGIRAALGATRRQLSRLVLTETVRLIGAGVVLGTGFAWIGAGLIRSFLFRVEPFDVLTLATVVGSVLLLALGVSLRPALQAGRIQLTRMLRDE